MMAHPGHELVVHAWLQQAAPRVGVLTDGSTREMPSRLDSTRKLLDQAGSPISALFGRHTDAALYERILDRDIDLFVGLAREVSKEIVAERIERVVGDCVEGYNVVHDLFRIAINAGIAIAERELSRPVQNYEYPLFERPGPRFAGDDPGPSIVLTEQMRADKLEAARAYKALDREVKATIERHGVDAYATEWLRPVRDAHTYRLTEMPPVYERFGEFLVRTGEFDEVIRYREHMLPITDALADLAENG
jgi:hypothetical protein